MSKSFWEKYNQRYIKLGSRVCIGLDSQLDKLPQAVRNSQNPILEFNRAIIDATHFYAGAYKPNLAFYLADGMRGLEALAETISYIPDDIPVILDCKVGDIGSTMQGYVRAFFTELKTDAITINPLMGKDVVSPLLEIEGSFGFALALTSNPGADDFFHNAKMKLEVPRWMQQYPVERIGAVVGATQVQDLKLMRELMPGRLFLIPGIGAQGGDLRAVLDNAVHRPEDPRILINSSRGIIFASLDEDFAQKAGQAAKELFEQSRA